MGLPRPKTLLEIIIDSNHCARCGSKPQKQYTPKCKPCYCPEHVIPLWAYKYKDVAYRELRIYPNGDWNVFRVVG